MPGSAGPFRPRPLYGEPDRPPSRSQTTVGKWVTRAGYAVFFGMFIAVGVIVFTANLFDLQGFEARLRLMFTLMPIGFIGLVLVVVGRFMRLR